MNNELNIKNGIVVGVDNDGNAVFYKIGELTTSDILLLGEVVMAKARNNVGEWVKKSDENALLKQKLAELQAKEAGSDAQ